MGFRTVVMLSNDQSHQWENDPGLGKRIQHSASTKHHRDIAEFSRYADRAGLGSCGEAVEQVHADTATLAILDGYDEFTPLAYTQWRAGVSAEDRALALLKAAADKLGYRLAKKPAAPRKASGAQAQATTGEYVVVENAGTDAQAVVRSFQTANKAYAFVNNPARTHSGLDVMKRLPDGTLTTEV
jgi:hypothetical protein